MKRNKIKNTIWLAATIMIVLGACSGVAIRVYRARVAEIKRLLLIAAIRQHDVIRGFAALDSTTGKVRWKYERPGLDGVSIIVSNGAIYACGSDGCVYRFSSAVR